jgi:apolipoprotein D and lipocalin family protein
MDGLTPTNARATTGASIPAGSEANRPVDYLDLQRYAGEWHEIAHLPMYYEKQCADSVTATYSLLQDGTIEVRNSCRTRRGFFDERLGVAKSTDIPGALKVRFSPRWLSWLPFVWADYWVVGLDLSYQWALVGGPTRKYLWILSRTPRIKRALFKKLTDAAAVMGYDTSLLIMTSELA